MLKTIEKFIIIMIIVVILLIVSLMVLLKNTNKNVKDFENVIYDDKVEKVTNKTTFFTVYNCMNTYLKYKFNNNTDAIKSISKEDNIIDKQYNSVHKFYIKDICSIDKVNNITVFANGVVRENEIQDEYYVILNFDYNNNTFEIIKSSKKEFENAKNNQMDEKYKEIITIEKNDYNAIEKKNITDQEILQYYFEDYKYKALYNQEEAFSLLDNEYKKAKFNNDINQYKTYIQNNIDKIKDSNLINYEIKKSGQYGTYIARDNYNNYYKIIETEINKYTIILDNYTIQTEEFVEKYNNASDKQQIATNVDKIIKLINTKSYTELYSYLNKDFKNNYFKTQADFEKYIKEKFFENNIVGSLKLKMQGDVYIVTVPYKESLSSAAENREITLYIRLNNDTNFELSFNVE